MAKSNKTDGKPAVLLPTLRQVSHLSQWTGLWSGPSQGWAGNPHVPAPTNPASTRFSAARLASSAAFHFAQKSGKTVSRSRHDLSLYSTRKTPNHGVITPWFTARDIVPGSLPEITPVRRDPPSGSVCVPRPAGDDSPTSQINTSAPKWRRRRGNSTAPPVSRRGRCLSGI